MNTRLGIVGREARGTVVVGGGLAGVCAAIGQAVGTAAAVARRHIGELQQSPLAKTAELAFALMPVRDMWSYGMAGLDAVHLTTRVPARFKGWLAITP